MDDIKFILNITTKFLKMLDLQSFCQRRVFLLLLMHEETLNKSIKVLNYLFTLPALHSLLAEIRAGVEKIT